MLFPINAWKKKFHIELSRVNLEMLNHLRNFARNLACRGILDEALWAKITNFSDFYQLWIRLQIHILFVTLYFRPQRQFIHVFLHHISFCDLIIIVEMERFSCNWHVFFGSIICELTYWVLVTFITFFIQENVWKHVFKEKWTRFYDIIFLKFICRTVVKGFIANGSTVYKMWVYIQFLVF